MGRDALRRSRIAAGLAWTLSAIPAATMPAAADNPWFEALTLEPWHPGDMAAHSARGAWPAPLQFPAGWATGDAATILLADGPAADPGREPLIATLLGDGTAVLELRAAPGAGAADLLPDVFAALRALRRDAGAGLVVVLGHGAAGEAALAAAALAAERRRDDAFAGLAAAAKLGPGPARFVAGPLPDAGEGWPGRAPILCALLRSTAAPGARDFLEDCVGAFLIRATDGAGPGMR